MFLVVDPLLDPSALIAFFDVRVEARVVTEDRCAATKNWTRSQQPIKGSQFEVTNSIPFEESSSALFAKLTSISHEIGKLSAKSPQTHL